ncbi:MAG: hypothetical protein JWO95_398 [Verrucomicrobiales bacterium]|nr:hypothetical protein [Verrucomicrobiales bacterium]
MSPKPIKVLMIERSLRCFYCGVMGLIPVLGVPLAIWSMQQYWRVKRDTKGMWNPAETYLKWGLRSARISLATFVILLGSITVLVLYPSIFTSSSE